MSCIVKDKWTTHYSILLILGSGVLVRVKFSFCSNIGGDICCIKFGSFWMLLILNDGSTYILDATLFSRLDLWYSLLQDQAFLTQA